MAKLSLKRIYEPDENMVHFAPVGAQDAVTLCNKTDWIGETEGYETRKPISCNMCRWIVQYVQNARTEKF